MDSHSPSGTSCAWPAMTASRCSASRCATRTSSGRAVVEHLEDPLVQPVSQHAEVLPRVAQHGAQLLIQEIGLVERLVLCHQLIQEPLLLVLELLPRREQ